MEKVIFKYDLTGGNKIGGVVIKEINIPIHSQILSIGLDKFNNPVAWVMQSHDDNQQMKCVTFKIMLTGVVFKYDGSLLHHATLNKDGAIFHIFECR